MALSSAGGLSLMDSADSPIATNPSSLTQTAGTPITNVSSTYSWCRIGLSVFARGCIVGTQGTTVSNISFALPPDMPTPAKPTGVTGNSAACYDGACNARTALNSAGNTGRTILRTNSTDTGFEISLNFSSGSHVQVNWEIQYEARV